MWVFMASGAARLATGTWALAACGDRAFNPPEHIANCKSSHRGAGCGKQCADFSWAVVAHDYCILKPGAEMLLQAGLGWASLACSIRSRIHFQSCPGAAWVVCSWSVGFCAELGS